MSYLKCGTELLLNEWNSEQWRSYWVYLYIRQLIRFNREGSDINYQFRGKFEKGMEENYVNNGIFPVFGLGFCFNTFLTNEYYDRYENKQYVEYVKNLAQDLKAVFTKIIQRNTWLQPKTKKLRL